MILVLLRRLPATRCWCSPRDGRVSLRRTPTAAATTAVCTADYTVLCTAEYIQYSTVVLVPVHRYKVYSQQSIYCTTQYVQSRCNSAVCVYTRTVVKENFEKQVETDKLCTVVLFKIN